MPANLHLKPFALPRLPSARIRSCLTDPTRRRLGLLTDEGLTVLSAPAGLADQVLFSIPAPASRTRQDTLRMSLFGQIANLHVERPADEAPLAIHSQANLVAHVTDEHVQLIWPEPAAQSARTVYTFPDAGSAQVKGALFSCSGQVLWVSREYPYSAARQSLPDPWHEVLAFSTADYRLLGRAAVQGELEGGHNLAAHPPREVVGVEVSCGQDGSWITFASLEGGELSVSEARVNGNNEPFYFAGFAADGNSLITVGATVTEEFQWPGCQSTARVGSEVDGDEAGEMFFGWNGAYVGGFFFTLAEGEEADVLRAYACPGLRPMATVQVEADGQELSGRLYGLGDDLLIAHGAGGVQAWQVTAP